MLGKLKRSGVATVVDYEEVRQCCAEPRAISSAVVVSLPLSISFLFSFSASLPLSPFLLFSSSLSLSFSFSFFLSLFLFLFLSPPLLVKSLIIEDQHLFPRSFLGSVLCQCDTFDTSTCRNDRKTGQGRSNRRAKLDEEEEEAAR